jgi:hypothetical protein
MSKTGARSILDLFLLAVFSDGVVATPYDLAQRLGISPGASILLYVGSRKMGSSRKKRRGLAVFRSSS